MAEDTTLQSEYRMYQLDYQRSKKMLATDCKIGNGMHKDGNKIVFFLGAGINGRNMAWNAIIDAQLKKAIKRFCYEHGLGEDAFNGVVLSNPMKASIVKHISKTAYINHMRDFIYTNGPRKKDIRELINNADIINKENSYYALYALAKIIVENKNVVAIVTYNYDKFLTYAIEEYAHSIGTDIKCREVYGGNYGDVEESRWRYLTDYSFDKQEADRVLPILHMHGYLAPYDELQNSLKGDEIVMTDEEFYMLAKDNFSWITASQLHYLSHYTSVFVGLSLQDQTTQRMLHFVKQSGDLTHNKYYLAACEWKNGEGRNKASEKYLLSSLYKELGITTIMSVDGYSKLYEDLIECMTR